MTFLLHLRLLSMQREDQIELTTSSPKKAHYETKDMFKTFITCESCCCCCWFCCCCSWWWWCYWTMCFCMWKSEMMRAKKASNKPTKRWKKKTKCILVLLCASVISSVSRSFVLSVRLSVDGHIDFFVRFPSNGLHICKKTPHSIAYHAPSSIARFRFILLLQAHWRVTFEHNLTFYALCCDMYMIRKISEMMIEIIGSLADW